MGIFNWFRRTKDERAVSVSSFGGAAVAEVIDYGTDDDNDSSLWINENVALQASVFYGCVNYIAKMFSTLSIGVYRDGGKGREPLKDHRVYRLLANPSPLYSGFNWRFSSQAQLSTYGDTVSLILNPYSPEPTLRLLPARSVQMNIVGDDPLYIIDGRTYTADNVLHIHGFSLDGTGKCLTTPVSAAKRLLGLSLSAEDFGRSFFANGAQLGTTYISPVPMKPEAKLQFLAMKARQHQGPKKAFKGELLDAGMTKQTDGVEPDKGQFVETRTFVQKQIMAEIFHLPPSLFDLGNARSTEDEGILVAQNCILPIVKNWEGELNRKLLSTEEQRDGQYIEFNLDSLNRANLTTRFNSYSVGRQIGLYTNNYLADKENLPHDPTPAGDSHWVPLNWISTDMIKDVPKPNDPKNNPNTVSKMSHEQPREARSDSHRFTKLIEDAARRMLTKEIKAVERAAKKFFVDANDSGGFRAWADDFYSAHENTIRQTFSPIVETMAEERAAGLLDTFIDQHCTEGRKDLALAIWSDNPASQIEKVIARWDQRATLIAQQFIRLEEDGRT